MRVSETPATCRRNHLCQIGRAIRTRRARLAPSHKRTCELGAPLLRMWARLGTFHVAFPEVGSGDVAVGGNPCFKLAPRRAKAFVCTMVLGARGARRRQQAGMYAADAAHGC